MTRPTKIEDYRALQESIFGEGRRWILAMDVLQGATGLIEGLRNRGAGECLAIAASDGTGPKPEPEWGPEPIVLGVEAETMMEGIWKAQNALANLDDEVVARIDEFDPEGEVRVIGTIFDDGADVGGRRKFGRRLPEWRALEDKTTVDALWDEVGVLRAPSTVVPVELEALAEATARLDQGNGVVWAGDTKSGFHGGAEFTRWIRSNDDQVEVYDRFSKFCDTVRVMPFLEGIPCSIHGIVFPDFVIAGRPCEMLVLRQPSSSTFRYATASTFWDPPVEERDKMRELAKTVGAHLRATVDFRGAFTIDGVMTKNGFIPTELNPRFGGALGSIVLGMGLGLLYIDLALMEGLEVDWNPEHLESMILEHADNNRSGRSNTIVSVPSEESSKHGLRRVEDQLEWCEDESEEAIVSIVRGPATAGTYLGIRYNRDHVETGVSTAPLTAEVLAFLNEEWELGLPELEAAKDVTRRP